MDGAWLNTAVVHGIFWVIALAAAMWILGPAVMFALGRRRFAIEINEDPTVAEPRDGDPVYEEYFRELYELGYRPAGRSDTKIKYFSPIHWRWQGSGSRLMQSPDRKTTVAFYRVANHPLRYSATTLFEGGGALSTVFTAMKQNPSPAGNYRYVELLNTRPAQLVEEHAQNVADFCERRGLTTRRATLRQYGDEEIELGRRVIGKAMAISMYALIVSVYLMPAFMALRSSGHRLDFAPPWMHPSILLCGAAFLFAMMKFAVLPSRVPILFRMVPLLALMFLPTVVMGRLSGARDGTARAVTGALDQLESDADKGLPIQPAIDRTAALGPMACRWTLKRLAAPTATPARKQALHGALVRLKGSDLGDTYEAWLPWCREVFSSR